MQLLWNCLILSGGFVVIWLLCRTRGKVGRIVNICSLAGLFVCIGLWIGCCAAAALQLEPIVRCWASGFVGWGCILLIIYRRTRPTTANLVMHQTGCQSSPANSTDPEESIHR